MRIKMVLSLVFMIFLVYTLNLFSYTLPKEADMLKFLPDKVGNWVVDRTFDFGAEEFGFDSDNSYRSVVKMYKNGNKTISVSINALIVTPISQQEYEENENFNEVIEFNCKESTKNTKIQGFDAAVITTDCFDNGMKDNSIMVTFIDDDNFYFNLVAESIIFEIAGFGELFGDSGELATTDDMINFLNMLDLKGIRSLVG